MNKEFIREFNLSEWEGKLKVNKGWGPKGAIYDLISKLEHDAVLIEPSSNTPDVSHRFPSKSPNPLITEMEYQEPLDEYWTVSISLGSWVELIDFLNRLNKILLVNFFEMKLTPSGEIDTNVPFHRFTIKGNSKELEVCVQKASWSPVFDDEKYTDLVTKWSQPLETTKPVGV